MPDTTNIGSFTIPSSDPLFLGIVAIHVLLGIAAIVAGLVAMLSVKAPGRHPRAGTWYFWLLASLFATTTALSVMRWAHAYHLFIIGAFALAAAISMSRFSGRNHFLGDVFAGSAIGFGIGRYVYATRH